MRVDFGNGNGGLWHMPIIELGQANASPHADLFFGLDWNRMSPVIVYV